MKRIRIPATTANMGPGFDCIGMAFDMYNYIDFEPTGADGYCELTSDGDAGHIDLSKDNLIYKVVDKFIKQFSIDYSFKIALTKNIPMQAGLGGGSSNAATTLNMLDKFFKTNMSFADKIKFLDSLTSDGPYFIETKPAKVKGKGNIVR